MSKLRISFSKKDKAIYISHLDLIRTFQRAFFRAGVSVHHTEGYNPKPYISILQPLSLGYTGENELVDVELINEPPEDFIPRMNAKLPDGIQFNEFWEAKTKQKEIAFAEYKIRFNQKTEFYSKEKDLNQFLESENITVLKKTKRGEADVNIRPMIHNISYHFINNHEMDINTVLSNGDQILNPIYLCHAIQRIIPEANYDITRVRFLTSQNEIFK